jgi:hypothetical protein
MKEELAYSLIFGPVSAARGLILRSELAGVAVGGSLLSRGWFDLDSALKLSDERCTAPVIRDPLALSLILVKVLPGLTD